MDASRQVPQISVSTYATDDEEESSLDFPHKPKQIGRFRRVILGLDPNEFLTGGAHGSARSTSLLNLSSAGATPAVRSFQQTDKPFSNPNFRRTMKRSGSDQNIHSAVATVKANLPWKEQDVISVFKKGKVGQIFGDVINPLVSHLSRVFSEGAESTEAI